MQLRANPQDTTEDFRSAWKTTKTTRCGIWYDGISHSVDTRYGVVFAVRMELHSWLVSDHLDLRSLQTILRAQRGISQWQWSGQRMVWYSSVANLYIAVLRIPFSFVVTHSDVAIKPGCLQKSIVLAQPLEECENEQFPLWILMSDPVWSFPLPVMLWQLPKNEMPCWLTMPLRLPH